MTKTSMYPPNMPTLPIEPKHNPEKIPTNSNLVTTFFYGIMCLFVLHSVSFLTEYIYQSYCYPITWWGFLTSTITTNSNTCVAIKNVVTNLSGFMSNYVLQTTGIFVLFCKKIAA
tara:strand:+ start:42 stop:386 length:345 start_codon:yes stop_codon:yes gene_type:complete